MTPPSDLKTSTLPDEKPSSSARAVAKGRGLLARVAAQFQRVRSDSAWSGPVPGGSGGALNAADLQKLHDATLRIARMRELKPAWREILRASLGAAGAKMGLLWLREKHGDRFTLGASEGFSPEFERLVGQLPSDGAPWTTCDERRGRVVIRDVATAFVAEPYAQVAAVGGFRACHCVPISDAGGEILAVLAVHFSGPHEPDARERLLLDRYAQMAGVFIGRVLAEAALHRSEQRFRALAEHSSMIVWTSDSNGACNYLNARWQEFTGVPPADGLGFGWLECVHPEDRSRLRERFSSTLPPEAVQTEYRLRRKDGEYRWMLDAAAPRLGDEGEFLGYIGSMMDITARRNAEAAVRETAQRLSLATALGNLGDWSWDATTDRVAFSDRIASLIGIAAGGSMASGEAQGFVHVDDRAMIVQSVQRAVAMRDDFDVECRVRAGDDWKWIAMRGRAIYDANGAMAGLRGVVQDITTRKQSEQTLRAQEAQLRLVSTNAPVILSHWSRDHRLLFASRAFAERWKTTPETLLGRTVADVLGPQAWEAVKPYLDRVVAGEAVSFEKDIPYAGIGRRYMRVSYAPEIGEDGNVRGYFSAVSDITDRRRAELALRESEERLRLATQTGKVGLWDWDVVANRITWTDSLYEIHGVSPATFDTTIEAFVALVHPEDAAEVARAIQGSLASGDRHELEFRAVRPDGDVIWLYTNAVVLRDAGKPIRMLGATLDVTARKRAELALRESEEKFRALASHAPVGIYLASLRGDCVYVNANWCAMAGLEPEQAAGQGWVKALHPDDRARVFAEWQAALADHRPFSLEYRFLRGDGRVTWVQGGAVEFRDSLGVVIGRIGTVADITERKTAEFALRESEKRFRTLASRAPVGIFMTNPQGETVFVNDAWCALAGLKPDQALGRGWAQAVHPEDRERLVDEWNHAVSNGASSIAEYRFLRPNGEIAWVQGSAVQLRDGTGRLAGYVGTIADFTLRKAAEMALRESEDLYRRNAERLRLAMLAANLGDWAWDPATDIITFSPRGAEIFGVAGGVEVTRSQLRELLHPDDRERARSANEMAIATRSDYDIEYRLRHGNGDWRWIAAKGRGVYAADGRLISMLGVVQDVTARKLAEEKLRAQEAQLRLITTNAPTMLAHCDAQYRYLFVNRAYAERLELTPEDIIGRTMPEVLGDAGFRTLAPYTQSVLAGEAVQFETEVPYPNRGSRYMRASYVPDFADDGTVRGWLAAISDITERRRVEEALRASEARYRQLIEMLPVAIYTCDREGRIDIFNDAAVALWGRAPVKGVDRWTGAHRALHPDGTPIDLDRGAVATALRESRKLSSVEAVFEHPDGERRHVLANPHPIHDASGAVVGAVNALIDITEHKIAERNASFLNALSQELAALTDPDEIMRRATAAVGSYYGVGRCYFFEATDDAAQVKVSEDWRRAGESSMAGVYSLDHFGSAKWWSAVHSGVVAIDDAEKHALTAKEAAKYVALEMRAFATAPVQRDGRCVAALVLTTGQRRRWREDELTLLGNVVTLVWPMMERARAEAALQAHAEELEEKVEQRTASLREAIVQMEEFSYSVSHDLRSPLRAMNAYAEALVQDYGDKLDETARGYLDRIQRSSMRMENLTHDVLTYSRIAREEMQLAPIAVERVLRDLVDQYAELQPSAADVSIDAPHRVFADESSLGQCLGNLLTNAAKFVRPGQRPIIRVTSREVEGRVRIVVQDSGIGIPPQYHSALFQVFERVPTRARYEGTGIGLAIVRKAAERMGGRCGVESDGENGSRFWVELAKA